MKLQIEDLAEADLDSHIDYFLEHHPPSAPRFVEAIDAAFARLLEHPQIGALQAFQSSRLEHIRHWPIPRFENRIIYYRVADQVLQVLRVLHAAQDRQARLDNRK